jgi:hypothetical protein
MKQILCLGPRLPFFTLNVGDFYNFKEARVIMYLFHSCSRACYVNNTLNLMDSQEAEEEEGAKLLRRRRRECVKL